MEIKILGTGCPNCIIFERNTRLALEKAGVKADIIKVTNITDIMDYNIISVPGLVFDDKVVSSGKVLDVDSIVDLIKNNS